MENNKENNIKNIQKDQTEYYNNSENTGALKSVIVSAVIILIMWLLSLIID